jgi:hypothetical protein
MVKKYPRLRLRGVPENPVLRQGGPPPLRRRLLAREVFRLVFYMPHDHPDLSAGVCHAIDRYIQAVGEGPKTICHLQCNHDEGGWLTERKWHFARILLQNTKRWSYPEDYTAQEQARIEKLGFERGLLFTGGFGSPNGYELEYKARIPWRPISEETFVSQLTATLPVEYLEAHGAAQARQLVLDMASKLCFVSGHAGLALRIYGLLRPTDDAFRAEVLRYPGIDLRPAWLRQEWMGLQVDGVHWLNFLGPPLTSQLGGAQALRSLLHSPETMLMDLSADRVAVAIGEWPDAGDLRTGNTLHAYREFAQVLKPWLEPLFLPKWADTTPPRYTAFQLTEPEARRWWRRFLD